MCFPPVYSAFVSSQRYRFFSTVPMASGGEVECRCALPGTIPGRSTGVSTALESGGHWRADRRRSSLRHCRFASPPAAAVAGGERRRSPRPRAASAPAHPIDYRHGGRCATHSASAGPPGHPFPRGLSPGHGAHPLRSRRDPAARGGTSRLRGARAHRGLRLVPELLRLLHVEPCRRLASPVRRRRRDRGRGPRGSRHRALGRTAASDRARRAPDLRLHSARLLCLGGRARQRVLPDGGAGVGEYHSRVVSAFPCPR